MMKRVYFSLRTSQITTKLFGYAHENQLLALGAVVKGHTFYTYILPTNPVSVRATRSHGILRVKDSLYYNGKKIPPKEIVSPVTALRKFWRFLEEVLVPAGHDPSRDRPISLILIGESACEGLQRAKILCYNIIRFKVPCPPSLRIEFAIDTIPLLAKLQAPTSKTKFHKIRDIPPCNFLRGFSNVKTRVYHETIRDVTALDEAIAVKEVISGIGAIKNETPAEVLLRVKPLDWTSLYSDILSQVRVANSKAKRNTLKRLSIPDLEPVTHEDREESEADDQISSSSSS